ncbi:MAG: efflux RND transporter periplasmic adaptor subunit [Clostridia bacterium]|nr:efflux RND transporter periplasmic adaptor subunit [Clostridia bacterium]
MKRRKIALLAALCAVMAGCDLMPAEETFRTSPVIREYQRAEFVQSECTRGDLVLRRTINCVYVPVRTESLKFSISGEKYDEVYVKAGDAVKEGQLLIQLDLSDIEQQIEANGREIERLSVRLEHLEQDRALALKRTEIQYETAGEAERREALENVNRSWDDQRQSLEDSLAVARLRLEDYEAQLAKRQLRSPMDGTVTYVRRLSKGDVSSISERIVSVADSTMSLFRSETDLWDRFEPGQVVVITSSKVDYEAVVKTEEELGLPPQEKEPGKKAYVYFALTEPTFDLEDNDRGTLTIELDSRHDVLRVPSSAISVINGETVVYYQDEQGMRAYKNVTTGLEADKMVEVISGLEEGDLVIVK